MRTLSHPSAWSVRLVFVSHSSTRGGLIWLESPSSSLLWLDSKVMAWCRIYAPCSVCIDRGARVHAHARSLSTHKAGILPQFMPLRRFACIHWGFTRPSPDAAVPTGLLLPATPPVILTLLRLKSQSWPLRSWTTAPHSVRSWTSLLPKEPCWPRTPSRVEDGAGLCSSACQFPPTPSDILGPLAQIVGFPLVGLGSSYDHSCSLTVRV